MNRESRVFGDAALDCESEFGEAGGGDWISVVCRVNHESRVRLVFAHIALYSLESCSHDCVG